LKKNEKNSPKKKDTHEKSVEEKTEGIERILETAKELPTGIAVLRGLCKIKKYRHTSPKRKR
jgi:hypothetical protein